MKRFWDVGVAAFAVVARLLLSTKPGLAADQPVRVLLVTGVDYEGHHWRQTSPVLLSSAGAWRLPRAITGRIQELLQFALQPRYDCRSLCE